MWQKIKNLYHLLVAFAAALYFQFPSKKITVIGVTGTDGKTTTVNMIHHILKSRDKVSMISSVSAQIGARTLATGFHVTTPSAWQVQKYLAQAVDADSRYFILETTSHGLDQNRLAFIDFKVAVVTNITSEHLDYHKTWQNYALAKLKLFKNVDFSILNIDDQKSYLFLKDKVDGKVITYAKNRGDVNLKSFPVKLKIPGGFNLENALAGAAACQVLGLDKKSIIKSLSAFGGVAGRFQEINLGQDFKVIVDFAHTPNALAKTLSTLKSKTHFSTRNSLKASNSKSKLICVFGSAGERDEAKRPMMGKVADEISDVIILTAEDPRSERVEDIVRQIASGIKSKKLESDLFVISDRRDAINFAVNLAKSGDVIAILGKGHEKSMNYGRGEVPWDEFATVRQALKRRQHA